MSDRRAHPRYELFAQVQLSRENEVYVMATENISAGGIFVHGNPSDYPKMTIGSEVDLLIFPAENLMVDLTCRAKVVRVENDVSRNGFGLQFSELDDRNRGRLAQFLASTPPPLPPRRADER